jgi:hypothetical protein
MPLEDLDFLTGGRITDPYRSVFAAREQERRAAVGNVFLDGTRSASDGTMLEGVPPVPRGRPMGGRFFPVLFDPQDVPS